MALEPHDSINEPDGDMVVWRYYQTSQFLWVLQNQALHLSRLDQLNDPFEGYSPIKNLEKEVEGKNTWFEELPDDIDLGEPGERTKEKYELMRRMALVNCWSKGEEDSLAMWKSYLQSGDGVAVCSTYRKLVNAIDGESKLSYHVGKVNYFDYFDDIKETSNFFHFVMSKPRQYNYEREIRVFVWWPTSGEADFDEPKLGDLIEEDTLTAPTGIKVNVDLDMLIDGVYVSPFGPNWSSVGYWNDLLEKYGLEATAAMSRLAMEPDDVL